KLANHRVAPAARVAQVAATAAVAAVAVHATCIEADCSPLFSRFPSLMQRDLPYLRAYPEALQAQVHSLLQGGPNGLAPLLLRKYPQAHSVRTDKALYQYTTELKNRHLRNADAVNKVLFDSKIHVVRNALGL